MSQEVISKIMRAYRAVSAVNKVRRERGEIRDFFVAAGRDADKLLNCTDFIRETRADGAWYPDPEACALKAVRRAPDIYRFIARHVKASKKNEKA